MAKKDPLRFGNIILCSDILVEINRKISAIGMFTNDILVSGFPAPVRLALYVEAFPPDGEKHEINFSVLFNDEQAVEMRGTLEGGVKGQPVPIMLPQFEVVLPGEVELKIVATINSGRSMPIVTKKILKGDLPQMHNIVPPA